MVEMSDRYVICSVDTNDDVEVVACLLDGGGIIDALLLMPTYSQPDRRLPVSILNMQVSWITR